MVSPTRCMTTSCDMLSGRRCTASITENSTCPPSRIGMGSRLKAMMAMLMKAPNHNRSAIPRRTSWPASWAIRIGPPTCCPNWCGWLRIFQKPA